MSEIKLKKCFSMVDQWRRLASEIL